MKHYFTIVLSSVMLGLYSQILWAGPTTPPPDQSFKVQKLSAEPIIDGQLNEWIDSSWQSIPISPAMEKDRKNKVGKINVELQAGIINDMIYFAARWPDSKADINFRDWIWKGNKYKRDKRADDMFAIRFDLDGDYHNCMLSQRNYVVDTWLWSSGRSNQTGYAEDLSQHISTSMIENAAEYQVDDGKMIFIKRYKDQGTPIYKSKKINRKKKGEPRVSSVEVVDTPSESQIDVEAKGEWLDGYWHLEMRRKLDTGYSDDVSLQGKKIIDGAIAVFNGSGAEHKSNSGTIHFDLSCCQ